MDRLCVAHDNTVVVYEFFMSHSLRYGYLPVECSWVTRESLTTLQ